MKGRVHTMRSTKLVRPGNNLSALQRWLQDIKPNTKRGFCEDDTGRHHFFPRTCRQVTGPRCSFQDVAIAWCDEVTDHTRTRPSPPPEITLHIKYLASCWCPPRQRWGVGGAIQGVLVVVRKEAVRATTNNFNMCNGDQAFVFVAFFH